MVKIKKEHKPLIASLIIGICVFLFIFFLSSFEFFQMLELKSLDELFNLRGPNKPSNEIIILAIDNWSFEVFEKWPWPRTLYAEAIDKLKKVGAKVICLDIDFSSSQTQENDAIFAKSIKKAGNVLAVSTFEDETVEIDNKIIHRKKHNLPIKEIRDSLNGYGYTKYYLDIDKYVHKAQLFINKDNITYYPITVKVVSLYTGKSEEEIISNIKSKVRFLYNSDTESLTYDSVLINYCGPAGSFKTVSFFRLIKEEKSLDIFKDKIVLIGSTATILHDEFPASFGIISGVEIHANIINNMLKSEYLSKISSLVNLIVLVIVIVCVSFLSYKFTPIKSIFMTLGAVVIFLIVCSYLFLSKGYWINISTPLTAIVFSYIGNIVYKAVTEGKKKDAYKKIFQRYVSREVVEEILKNIDEVKLGGEKQHVTILFSDIRNFTAMSEKLKPEEVVELLNQYFTKMTDIVFKYRGTVDKFIGDAMMVLFGAPKYLSNSEELAVRVAVEMQEETKLLRNILKAETLEIGVGINSGEVIVGNIGSGQQMQYTVIGDTVNLASRLETLTKDYSIPIIISESVYNKVKDIVVTKDLGEASVKGKTDKVKIYGVTGLKK